MMSFPERQAEGGVNDLPGLHRRIRPLRRADLAELAGVAAAGHPPAEQASDGTPQYHGLHILVEDDTLVNQKVASRMLE